MKWSLDVDWFDEDWVGDEVTSCCAVNGDSGLATMGHERWKPLKLLAKVPSWCCEVRLVAHDDEPGVVACSCQLLQDIAVVAAAAVAAVGFALAAAAAVAVVVEWMEWLLMDCSCQHWIWSWETP